MTIYDLPKWNDLDWFDKLVLESDFASKTYNNLEELENAIREWAYPKDNECKDKK